MSSIDRVTVQVVPDLTQLEQDTATLLAREIEAAIDRRGCARVALSGGRTPIGVYDRLATRFLRTQPPAGSVQISLTDERCVPGTDERSNLHLIKGTLEQAGAGVIVHPMFEESRGVGPSASAMEDRLEDSADEEGFLLDVALVGVGADGHVLSIFDVEQGEGEVLVKGVAGAPPVVERMTLTWAAVARIRRIVVIAAGGAKSRAVAEALNGSLPPSSPLAWLAQRIERPQVWILDEDAASQRRAFASS